MAREGQDKRVILDTSVPGHSIGGVADILNSPCFGVTIDNNTDLWVEEINSARFIAPNTARSIRLDAVQSAKARFAAPPGKTQAAIPVIAQQCILEYTEEKLATTGAQVPSVLASNLTWPDGTVAAPGFPNANDPSMGMYRPAVGVFGFAVGGVEFARGVRTALPGGALQVQDGSAAFPSLGFANEPTSGWMRFGAGVLGLSILGVNRMAIAAGATQFSTPLQPAADATYELGNAALRWTNIHASTSLRIGTTVAATGDIRLVNAAFINWRNFANTLDPGITVNTSDQFEYSGNGMNLSGSATYLRIGTSPATTGDLRLPAGGSLRFRNAANTLNIAGISSSGDNTFIDSFAGTSIWLAIAGTGVLQINPTDVNFQYGSTAVGGGAVATLGLKGNANTPVTTAQHSWLAIRTAGVISYIPIWR